MQENSTKNIELVSQTPHQARVEQFMRLARQAVPDKPTIPDDKTIVLRSKLMYEENMETIRGMGVSPIYKFTVVTAENKPPIHLQIDLSKIKDSELEFLKTGPTNLEEVVDGCGDVSVVTIGTLSAFGVKDQPVLEAIDQNNLDKFGEGHSWREDGKLIKSPNHKKVDLGAVLKAQGV